MKEWLQEHATLLWWAGIVSAAMFVATLLAVPLIVVRMRADYFVDDHPADHGFRHSHPLIRTIVIVLKNVVGVVLLLAGIAMLVLPGQGILSILIGLSLLDFPGKRKLERRIVAFKEVRLAMNWIRAKANRPPIEFAAPGAAATGDPQAGD